MSEGNVTLLSNHCHAKLRSKISEIRFQAQKVLVVSDVPRIVMFSVKRKLNSPLTSPVSYYMTRFRH